MAIKNGGRTYNRTKNGQRDTQNDSRRLGISEAESSTVRTEPDTVLCADSEGRNQDRAWNATRGEKTIGGIYRRLNELHNACLTLIDSHQKQLESSLHESKRLTEEINNLQELLAKNFLNDTPESE